MEWRCLRQVPRKDGKVGVWDEDAVQEWSSVRRDAQRQNSKANVGLIFGIVVDKNHELPEHDPNRKYKGVRCSRSITSWTKREIGLSFKSWALALRRWRQHDEQMRTG